jgi:hypothetical protein
LSPAQLAGRLRRDARAATDAQIKPGSASRINVPGDVIRADENDDVAVLEEDHSEEDVLARCAARPMTRLHPKSRRHPNSTTTHGPIFLT